MSRASTARAVFVLLAIASSSVAQSETQVRTRVTIRGTGNNVTLERAEAPVGKRSFEKKVLPAGALGEAIRLEAQGADDAGVIAYLRAHQADLPSVIDAQDVRQLRKAGAGKPVVAFLATVAAVDIGEIGEGRERVTPDLTPWAAREAAYGMPYSYIGGYAAPDHVRFVPGRHFPGRRLVFRPGRPVFRRAFPPPMMSARRWMAQ